MPLTRRFSSLTEIGSAFFGAVANCVADRTKPKSGAAFGAEVGGEVGRENSGKSSEFIHRMLSPRTPIVPIA
jgi:hypothetical protein